MNNPSPTLRVVRVDPGHEPVDVSIPNNLQGLQAAVGGNVERFHVVPSRPRNTGRAVAFYCNEDGRRLALRPNRHVAGLPIVGPVLVVGVLESEEVDLTDTEVEDVVRAFERWPKIG